MSDAPAIEFFFDIGSPYTYLASTQIDALAARAGREVRWRPFLLGAVFKATGNDMPARVAAKAKWMLGDLERWATHYGVPFRFPSRFPVSSLRPERALVAAGRLFGEPAIRRLAVPLFRIYWVEDGDPTTDASLRAAAAEAGVDADVLLPAIDAPETKDALRVATDEAVKRGAFGAPTMYLGERMYWGNDRLHLLEEDARRRTG